MRIFGALRSVISSVFRREEMEAEMEEELRAHMRDRADDLLRSGLARAEAERRARLEFGGYQKFKEECREAAGTHFVETVMQDIRYALRVFRKSPAFTAVAVLTLALAIGVNTGIFQIFNAVALRPVELGTRGRMLSVYQDFQVLHPPLQRNVHDSVNLFSYMEYTAYRDQNHAFSGLLAYVPFVEVTLAGEEPKQLLGSLASCNYFEVLGIRPRLGRAFLPSDCAAEGSRGVVILSDETWKGAFAADRSILGKTISLNHVFFTVIGVAPPGFAGMELARSAFWAPVTMQPAIHASGGQRPDMLADDDLSWLKLIGRVRGNLSDREVLADLSVISARLDRHHPGAVSRLTVSTPTFVDMPDSRRIIVGIGRVILFAVGLVLLIACANVANLSLARASARRREIAVRLATGASRRRLVRQLLTESLLLACMGGALGAALAFWSFTAILNHVLSTMPAGFPSLNLHLSPDVRVFAYLFGLTVITAVAFGLIPALQATRLDVNAQLKEEGSAAQSRSPHSARTQRFLVGLQVAVSMVLLVLAGLSLRTLYRAQTVDPGFAIQNLQALSFDLGTENYTPAHAAAFELELIDRISALPGIEAVAQATALPLGNSHFGTSAEVPGHTGERNVELNYVSPNYFTTISLPIVRGRTFRAEEVRTDARAMIVTEAAARAFWPNADPLGKNLKLNMFESPVYEIVGVAKDAQVSHLGEAHPIYLYLPAGPAEQTDLKLLVRPSTGFEVSQKLLRSVVAALDPTLTGDVHALSDYLEQWRAPARIAAELSGALGALALLLASAGVYATVCFALSQRIREIGIRIALGADSRDVMRLMLWQAMGPVLMGGLIGMVCCSGIVWGLSRVLYGLSSYDPISFIVAPSFLIATAVAASYIPARHALRVDPMVALRYE